MRGISPIVAVVLLIAIAVIAAVGLYFWVGSLTGKQATPSTPSMITANVVCGSSNTSSSTILITNIGTKALQDNLYFVYPNGTQVSLGCGKGLSSGNTTKCTVSNFGLGSGTATIYGNGVGSISVHC